MHEISNKTRHAGYGEISFEDSDLGRDFSSDINDKIIKKAELVKIIDVLRYYNIIYDSYSKKIKCPFPFHKNGAENTPSLVIYVETNSFYCWGCKSSGNVISLVSKIEDISKYDAANKICKTINNSSGIFYNSDTKENINDRNNLIIEFSNFIRRRIENKDISYILEVEKCSKAFDKILCKHKINNENLSILIGIIKSKIEKI